MGNALRARVAQAGIAVVAAVAVAGCGQSVTGSSHRSATAPFGAPVVSLLSAGAGPVRVIGGTSAMRARAREILDGMGDVAISEVRFGRPPESYGRFRRVDGPIWLSTTVAADGSPSSGTLRSQLAADGPLWQASVFDSAYLASQPAGAPRVRGTSEALSLAGRVEPFSGQTGPADPYAGPAEPDSAVRRVIERAAARARFRVVSISLMHPNRQAATIVVRAVRRASFARRYDAFHAGLAALSGRLDGLQWQVVDACGYPVAVESTGIWTSPRWLCPNPYVPGYQMTRATCRKLPRGFPPCASTG
jgi:hypothetical protein